MTHVRRQKLISSTQVRGYNTQFLFLHLYLQFFCQILCYFYFLSLVRRLCPSGRHAKCHPNQTILSGVTMSFRFSARQQWSHRFRV